MFPAESLWRKPPFIHISLLPLLHPEPVLFEDLSHCHLTVVCRTKPRSLHHAMHNCNPLYQHLCTGCGTLLCGIASCYTRVIFDRCFSIIYCSCWGGMSSCCSDRFMPPSLPGSVHVQQHSDPKTCTRHCLHPLLFAGTEQFSLTTV